MRKRLVIFTQLELMPMASKTGESIRKIATIMYIILPLGMRASKCILSTVCAVFLFLTGACGGRLSLIQLGFSDPLIWHRF